MSWFLHPYPGWVVVWEHPAALSSCIALGRWRGRDQAGLPCCGHLSVQSLSSGSDLRGDPQILIDHLSCPAQSPLLGQAMVLMLADRARIDLCTVVLSQSAKHFPHGTAVLYLVMWLLPSSQRLSHWWA